MADNPEKQEQKQQLLPDSSLFPPLDPNKTPKQAYFELLRVWVQQAQMQHQIQAYFPYYLMNNYPQLFQVNSGTMGPPGQGGTAGGQNPAATGGTSTATGTQPGTPGTGQRAAGPQNRRRLLEILGSEQQEELINRHGGYEYVIAPVWKRFVAELIDIIIIFLLKVMITMALIDFFDIDLLELDLDALRDSLEADYRELLSVTSELIFVEILVKVAVCIYETMWTIHGQGQIGGATPGKMLMGIRIVHVQAVVILDPQPAAGGLGNNQAPIKALLYPVTNPGFKRAFGRAVAKNTLIALFFPVWFLLFVLKPNRTLYDFLTKTLVVEDNPAPVLRRR